MTHRVVCLVTLAIIVACAPISVPSKRTIRGTIVAYSQIAALTKITSAPQEDIVIFKVEGKPSSGAEDLFKKIIIRGLHGEPLPLELFEQGHKWEFLVTETEDSERCRVQLPFLKWLDEESRANAPELNNIECLAANRSGVSLSRPRCP